MQDARILVVEDEPLVARDIRLNLEALGYLVVGSVETGEEALARAGELRPDLVLMDIVLPGKIDGIEAADRIGSAYDIPVVYLTAYADEALLERAKITDALGYILKPFTQRELHAVVSLALYRARSERQLQNFFWGANICSSVRDAVIAVDPELRVAFFNDSAAEDLGLEQASVVGKPWEDSLIKLAGAGPLKIRQQLKRAINKGERWEYEGIVEIDLAGNKAYAMLSIDPVLRRGRHILGAMIVLRDVTARHLAEQQEALQRSRAAQYLDVAGAMMVATDLEGRVVLANPAACRILGYPAKQILGCDWFAKFVPKRVRSEARAEFAQLVNGGLSFPAQAEARVLTRSGEERIVLWDVSPLRDAAGETVGMIGSGLDMTERRRLEVAMEKSRDFYLSLLEHLPLLVWRSDVTGQCDYFNEAWLSFTGRQMQEELGEGWAEGVHPDDRARVLDTYSRAFKQREPFTMEYRLRSREGDYHTILDAGQPTVDLEGKFSGYIGGCVDIEYKLRVETDLRQLSRALRVLSRANETLVRAASQEGLLREICRIIVDEGGYRMAWVGLAEHDKARSVRPVAASGVSIEEIADLNITWAETPRGKGPTGRAIRTGSSVVLRQVSEPDYEPWRDAAQRFGYASSVALPISLGNSMTGALNIYAVEPDAFDADELKLLTNLSEDLSFGLNALRERRALDEQIERNELILRTVRDGFWIVDLEGNIRDVNQAYCELVGYSRDELLSMKVSDIDAKDAQEDVHARIQALKEHGHARFETQHRTKSGDLVDIDVSATLAQGEKGPVLFAFFRDISERKRGERLILENETKYRALFELANDAIFLMHENLFVDCNERTLEMFNCTRDQIIGQSPDRFSPERQPDGRASLDKAREMIDRAFDGEPMYFEWKHKRRDGALFDAEVSLNRIRIFGQSYLQAIVRDITERKASERALRESEAYNRMLFETSPIGLSLNRLTGEFVDINPAFAKIVGRSVEEIRELSYWDVTPEAYGDAEREQLRRLEETGRYGPYEKEFIHKDGHFVPVRLAGLIVERHGEKFIWSSVEDISETRANEEALLRAHATLQDAQRLAKLGSWEFDLTTGILTWSEEVYRIFELDPQEFSVTYDAAIECIHPDDREAVDRAYRKSVAERTSFSIQHRLAMKDGRMKVVYARGESMYDATGKPLRSVGSIQDITERVHAEQALRQARDFSAAVLDTIGSVVLVLDATGRIVRFNQAAQKLTGYTENYMIGRFVWDDLLLPEQVESVKGVFKSLTAGKLPSHYVNYWLTKAGVKRLIDWSNTVLVDDAGHVSYVIATGIDITDKQQAQEGLARVEMQWNQAIDFFADPVYFVDMSDRVVRANAAFYKLTGLSPEQVVGRDITAVMHPGGEEVPCPVCAARRAREDAVIVMEAEHPDNPVKRPIEVTVRMIRNAPDAEPTGILMGLRDLTRQRQIESELRRHRDHLEELVEARTQDLATVNRELEAFSYSVSHDLRAPLRGIDGFSQALLEDYTDKLDERGRDYLQRVRGASQRMSQLIDDLLMLSRVTRNDMHRQTVDLSALAESVAEGLRLAHPERKVEISIQPGLQAEVDARLMRILLENVLGNAWKFTAMREVAEIDFYLKEGAGEPTFVVRDNGVGFDMSYAERMFSAFQRLHAEQDFEGTGVGLATVQRIVHRHGGRVYARGEVGKGASIFFTLPPEKGRGGQVGESR